MSPNSFDTAEALAIAVEAAQEAGTLQMENLHNSLRIDSKSSAVDMVTEIDKRCEELITRRISFRYPDHIILGEEEGKSSGDSEYMWIIDPLDGTTNYVHGLPVFASSIALFHRGEALVGVVHVAPLSSTYTAIRGEGAFKNGEPIAAAERKTLSESMIATGIPYDRAESDTNNLSYISHMGSLVRGIRRLGAAAYDLCLVAEGIFDGYWELKVSIWDVAAGALIAQEAGAVVNYRKEGEKYHIVCASPPIQPQLSEELNRAGDQFRGL